MSVDEEIERLVQHLGAVSNREAELLRRAFQGESGQEPGP